MIEQWRGDGISANPAYDAMHEAKGDEALGVNVERVELQHLAELGD